MTAPNPINFLVSHKYIGNALNNIVITEKYIIVQHAYTLSIFLYDWTFVREKQFYDKIQSFCVCGNQIVVLFGDKIVQTDFNFNCTALRQLKQHYRRIVNTDTVCYAFNTYSISWFKIKSSKVHYYEILSNNIKPIDTLDLTLLIQNNMSIQKVNVDGKSTVLDTFDLLDCATNMISYKNTIIVVYRHALEVFYKNERFLLNFSKYFYKNPKGECKLVEEEHGETVKKMIEVKLIGDHSKEKDIEHFHAENKTISHTFDNVHLFEFSNNLYFLQEDGKLYKIEMNLGVSRILDVNLTYIATLEQHVSNVVAHENGFILASEETNSVFYKLVNKKNKKDVVEIDNMTFEKHILENIGIVNSVDVRQNKTLLSTSNKLLTVENSSKVEYTQLFALRAKELMVRNNEIFYYIEERKCWLDIYDARNVIGKNSEHYLKDHYASKDENYALTFNGNTFNLSMGEEKIVEFTKEDLVGNKSLKIEEVCFMKKDKKLYLFIVANELLHMHALLIDEQNRILETDKVFIEEMVWFSKKRDRIHKGHGWVYVCSRIPYFIFLEDKPLFLRSKMAFDSIVCNGDQVYALGNEELGKIKVQNQTKRQNLFVSKVRKCENLCTEDNKRKTEEEKQRLNIKTKNIKLYLKPSMDNSKNIVLTQLSKTFTVAIKSKNVPYRHIPFIPIVHRTTDDNRTVTERIDPYTDNFNTAVLGQTKQFYVTLFDQNYAYLDEIEMDENEYVSDLKVFCEKYIAVSVVKIESEDTLTTSKIKLYSVQSVVGRDGATVKKLKFLCEEKMKFAVSAIDIFYKQSNKEIYHLNDILICAGVNTRLMVYEVSANEFCVVGRLEVGMSIQKLLVIRNTIILADIFNGIQFYFFRPENPLKLTFLADSLDMKEVVDLNISIWKEHVIFMSTTKQGVINVFEYNPDEDKLYERKHLIKLGELDTQIQKYAISNYSKDKNAILLGDEIFNVKCIMNNIHVEKLYKHLCLSIKNTCGLHPDAFLEGKSIKEKTEVGCYNKRVLIEYMQMSNALQLEIQKHMKLSHFSILKLIEDTIC